MWQGGIQILSRFRPLIYSVLILLGISAAPSESVATPAVRCHSIFLRDHLIKSVNLPEDFVKLLKAVPKVSSRMSGGEQSINTQSPELVTVYRGIDRSSFREIDFNHNGNKVGYFEKDFVSTSFHYAMSFAGHGGHLIIYRIPAILLSYEKGSHIYTIDPEKMKQFSLATSAHFVQKVGRVPEQLTADILTRMNESDLAEYRRMRLYGIQIEPLNVMNDPKSGLFEWVPAADLKALKLKAIQENIDVD